VRDYGALSAVVAAVVAVMVRPWVGGWSSPITYGNDTLSHLAMLDSAGITGTARGTELLGAPYGQSWIDFPLGPDRLHLSMFRILKLFTGEAFLALNLYVLLGFFLVAWASFAVLRAVRISPLVAGAVSVVFTIAPYHFARIADGHVFLAAYFSVPIGVLLALWASDGTIHRRMGRAHWVATVVCVVILGSSSAYYAAFSMVLVASLGLVVAVRRASWRMLAVPLVLSAAIGGVVAANTAGDVLANRAAGTNNEVSIRPVRDSQSFGLSLSQMVLPDPGHRISGLGDLGRETAQVRGTNESGSAVGLLALLGLLAIAVSCIRFAGGNMVGNTVPDAAADAAADDGRDLERRSLMLRLGVMVLAATLVATVASVSLLVAVLGFGQIRVWSRMSIVICYLGLMGLAVVLDRVVTSPRVRQFQLGPVLVMLALVVVAVIDQTAPGSLPDRGDLRAEQLIDREVATQLQSALPESAQVFELPQVDFLFDTQRGFMPLYGLLGPWASGDGTLLYSAAPMQGRGGDWQRSWAQQPPEIMIPGLAAAGFDAVYLDRRADETGVDLSAGPRVQRSGTLAASEWLRQTLGDPSGIVADGGSQREWFDLRPLRATMVEQWGDAEVQRVGAAVRRPIGVVYSGAVDRFAVADGARLLLADSSITLRDEALGGTEGDAASTAATGPVVVRFTLVGQAGSTVDIRVDGRTERVVLGAGATAVELDLAMHRRDSVIELRTDAPRLAGVGMHLGPVRLQVSRVQVVDAELDEFVLAEGFCDGESSCAG